MKPILSLQDEYINAVLENTNWKNNHLLHAEFTRFDYGSNPSTFVYPKKLKSLFLKTPSSVFTPAATDNTNQSIVLDSRYQDESSIGFNLGNVSDLTRKDGVTNGYIWNYQNQFPIAQVNNALAEQIAYTSFESDNKGYWDYNSSAVISGEGITGNHAYNLSGNNLVRSGLDASITYLISYWSKDGTGSVSGGASPLTSKNGWTLFSKEISGQGSFTLSGSAWVDEVRLYPKNAQLTTYTYEPLIGITSQCDATGRIQYFEYDALGRLKLIRDLDKKIVKSYDYQYQVTR